jgi:hypothetical protein
MKKFLCFFACLLAVVSVSAQAAGTSLVQSSIQYPGVIPNPSSPQTYIVAYLQSSQSGTGYYFMLHFSAVIQ